LLGEVRNKEWKPHDRSFVSEYRLKIMWERRKLYVCLWGGGSSEIISVSSSFFIFCSLI
jgi:hypothetical protein